MKKEKLIASGAGDKKEGREDPTAGKFERFLEKHIKRRQEVNESLNEATEAYGMVETQSLNSLLDQIRRGGSGVMEKSRLKESKDKSSVTYKLGGESILIGQLDSKGNAVLGIYPSEEEDSSEYTKVYLSLKGEVVKTLEKESDSKSFTLDDIRSPGEDYHFVESMSVEVIEKFATGVEVDGRPKDVEDEFLLGRIVGINEKGHFVAENPEWIEWVKELELSEREESSTLSSEEEPAQYLDPESKEYAILRNHLQLMAVTVEQLNDIRSIAGELRTKKYELENLRPEYQEKRIKEEELEMQEALKNVYELLRELNEGIESASLEFVGDNRIHELDEELVKLREAIGPVKRHKRNVTSLKESLEKELSVAENLRKEIPEIEDALEKIDPRIKRKEEGKKEEAKEK